MSQIIDEDAVPQAQRPEPQHLQEPTSHASSIIIKESTTQLACAFRCLVAMVTCVFPVCFRSERNGRTAVRRPAHEQRGAHVPRV